MVDGIPSKPSVRQERTMNTAIAREQAEQVVAKLQKKFKKNYHDHNPFSIRDHNHEGLPEGSWSIDWEGEVPDWAFKVKENIVPGVHVEALEPWCLAVYPPFD